jgi:hypothetical protein
LGKEINMWKRFVSELRRLHDNQDGFFGIGMGPDSNEKQQYGLLSGIAGFGSSQGKSDVMKAQDFWSSILSGDMSKISQVLAPEISSINKQTQQRKLTTSQFNNRGGGTNAYNQSLDDNALSSIRGMISNLTGSAASNIGNLGTSLLSTGLSGGEAAFGAADTMHQQNAAKWNDIFKSIGEVAGAAAGFFPGGSMASKRITGAQGTLLS